MKSIIIAMSLILLGCSSVNQERIETQEEEPLKIQPTQTGDAGAEPFSNDGCAPIIIITTDPLSIPNLDCLTIVLPPADNTPPSYPDPIKL